MGHHSCSNFWPKSNAQMQLGGCVRQYRGLPIWRRYQSDSCFVIEILPLSCGYYDILDWSIGRKMPRVTPRGAILKMLSHRAPTASLCPSEAARTLAIAAGTAASRVDWRDMMPSIHAAVDRLLAEGAVQLSWKGKPLMQRAGPYRISGTDRAAFASTRLPPSDD